MNLRSRLYNCLKKTLAQCNKTIFQSKNRLSNLFRFKDSIPEELCSHLVYRFLCSNYNTTYYVDTERQLNVRSGENLVLSPITGKRAKKIQEDFT